MSNAYREVEPSADQKMVNIQKAEVSFYVRGSDVCMKRTFTGSTFYTNSSGAISHSAILYVHEEQERWQKRGMVLVIKNMTEEVWMPFTEIVSVHIKCKDFMVPEPKSRKEEYSERTY